MFVNNFMTALAPQITKSYAADDKEYAFSLACRGSRFSFYIMYLLGLPLMIEAKQILQHMVRYSTRAIGCVPCLDYTVLIHDHYWQYHGYSTDGAGKH